jgi:hypothetical protein
MKKKNAKLLGEIERETLAIYLLFFCRRRTPASSLLLRSPGLGLCHLRGEWE